MLDIPINSEKTTKTIVEFIRRTFHSSGFSKAVIGLSGGVDSATSLALTVRALGKENIYPCIFPYGMLNRDGEQDALFMAEHADIPSGNVTRINIQSPVDTVVSTDPAGADDLRRGNILVRMRMVFLFDQAKKRNALVVGTENRTEHLLGYFTRFGDEASDIEPLLCLYKTQVKTLAKYLGIPEKIISKPPTAGMWEGQTDEGEFGFTYEDADGILHLFADEKMSAEEIIKKGYAKETVGKVLKRYQDNLFKHKVPYHL